MQLILAAQQDSTLPCRLVGGALIAVIGPQNVLLVDAVTFAASAGVLPNQGAVAEGFEPSEAFTSHAFEIC